ncbi:hypothetical protein G7Y89_g15464 [Cudoniella acicularis]|uniref:Uncharacterized protein n=1 Tax=Cudoniella acicularis TaxID=354080 RepID=A0A8H4VKN8_9HELO|nr:hypothetical protein G7Y89_g15464 [Cudoniella acicularis]
MQFTNIAASLALVTAVLGSTIRRTIPENYEIGTMKFNGSIHGVPWYGEGTIQEIYAEFTKAHPDAAANDKREPKPVPAKRQLHGDPNKYGEQCCPIPGEQYGNADNGAITDGIAYLKEVDAYCNCGPTSCVRISCSDSAAIFLCNDTDEEIWNGCNYMATFAQDIMDDCTTISPPPLWYQSCCGQEYHTNGFHVVVRYDSC